MNGNHVYVCTFYLFLKGHTDFVFDLAGIGTFLVKCHWYG